MREIKFRCWSDNKMYEIDSIDFWDETVSLTGAGYINMENAKLMQYTGLKDKNGKEIYEGDIVRTNFGQDFLVKWIKRLASFCYVEIVRDSRGKCSLSKELQAGSYEVEVIGNKYDNPDLLKEE